jgi:hypothetical protein
VKISKEIRDIIHGYIMSDGYITETGSLQVDQSEKQEKFVMWLYDKLELIRKNTPISDISRTDKRSGKKTYSKRFYTKTLLKGFRFMWYKPIIDKEGNTRYIKRLPKSIACFFNSICVSLWFAGDGTKKTDSRGANIEVTAFTPAERQTLKELFKQKFNISVNIIRAGVTKSGTEQWNLAINASEYDKFRILITQIDLIPNLFPYKLHKQKYP